MFSWITRLFEWFQKIFGSKGIAAKKEELLNNADAETKPAEVKIINIVVLGSLGSGMSTLCKKMGAKPPSPDTDSIKGILARYTVEYRGIEFVLHEIGVHHKVGIPCDFYCEGAAGLVYVVSCSDLVDAGRNMKSALTKFFLQEVPILVFANKCDLAPEITREEVISALGLDSITNQPWNVELACALDGMGIAQGLEWMADNMADVE